MWAGSSEIGLYVGADTAPSHPVRRRDFPRTSVWKLGTTLLTEEFVHLAPLVHGSPPFADTPVQRLTPITDATQRQFGRRRGRPPPRGKEQSYEDPGSGSPPLRWLCTKRSRWAFGEA